MPMTAELGASQGSKPWPVKLVLPGPTAAGLAAAFVAAPAARPAGAAACRCPAGTGQAGAVQDRLHGRAVGAVGRGDGHLRGGDGDLVGGGVRPGALGGARGGRLDQHGLAPSAQVGRAVLGGPGTAQVDGVPVEPHAAAGRPVQVDDRPGGRHPQAHAVVPHGPAAVTGGRGGGGRCSRREGGGQEGQDAGQRPGQDAEFQREFLRIDGRAPRGSTCGHGSGRGHGCYGRMPSYCSTR